MSGSKIPLPLTACPQVCDWVSVSADGSVGFLSGRVELGQGSFTALCQMIAGELGCAVKTITLTIGVTGTTPNEGYTAGSMSVASGGSALRWAASAFRVLVLGAAAEQLGCDASSLSLKDWKIFRDGNQTGLAAKDLSPALNLSRTVADLAAPLAVGKRFVPEGDASHRLDLKKRLVGAPFVHDMQPSGLLFGKPIHPPSLTARLVEIDVDGLKNRPGIVAVVRDGSFLGIVAQSEVDAIAAARWARTRAKWTDTAQAPNDALQAIAGSMEPAETVHTSGKPEAQAGQSFETTISRPYLYHGSIGPVAAVAEWQDGGLNVFCHSQGVYQLRGALCAVLDLPEERVTVEFRPGAGCYGHNGADDVALDAALLARAVPGRPVKVVWSRIDEFQSAPMGPAMVTSCRAVIDDAGQIKSMRINVNSTSHGMRPGIEGRPNLRAGAYLENPIPILPTSGLPLARGGDADRNALPLYAIENIEITKRIVNTLPYRTSSLRGLGAHANIYAIETFMDEIAAELEQDPIEFRLKHLADERARNVITSVVKNVQNVFPASSSETCSWGLGFARYKNTAGYCAIMAQVEIEKDIHVTHVEAVADIGEIVSRDGAINQIEGGIIQSLSWTLKEAVRLEGAYAAPQNWLDYPILKFSEIPEVSVSLIERPDDPPLGCGEVAQGPAAAAVGNAVRAALGVTIKDLPLTRDRVMQALL